MSFYQSGGNINDLFVAGVYSYIADGADGLRIVDVSDSTNPVEVALYEEAGNAKAVFVSNNYAFIGESSDIPNGGIFRVIDVIDPSNPEEIGTCQIEHYIDEIFVMGDYAYLACYEIDHNRGIHDGSLRVIDLYDLEYPEEIGIYYIDTNCYDVFVAGNYIYLTMRYVEDNREYYCIRIIDCSQPENLEEVGLFHTLDKAIAVFLSDDYAYITISDSHPGEGTTTYYLSINDISDPTSPEEVSTVELPGEGNDIFVSGQYVYIADGWEGGVRVIDVSDPENPVEVGYYNTPGSAQKIMANNGMIYVADWTNMGIYRFTDPVRVDEKFKIQNSTFKILPAFPNPFNSSTNIQFGLDKSTPTRLEVYNLRGQLVDVLLDRVIPAGKHSAVWDLSLIHI